ncbi:MAG TPA: type II/IV secretion system ATPase subunit [Candidatus Paceibacterota bacterium]|nr:type II/IV secretion system ATPase subunit [Candidatus Paceibacterota bacterium]
MESGLYIDTSPPIPALPIIKDKSQIDVRYTVTAPYTTIHVYWDFAESELKYEIEEPMLDDNEIEVLGEIENAMTELININLVVEKTQEAILDYIDKTAKLLINELNIKILEESYQKIFYYLYRDFVGFNEIDALMNDYFIEDIECNGINTPVYIVHRIYRNIKTNIVFTSVENLASFVEKLAQRSGRYISYASPILDGSLPDGSRVNATYTTDITSKGPTFTIRKFTTLPWTPIQLISFNTLSPEMLAYFWMIIQYKSNILIAGGTSSGKTTLLNAISFFIPPESRVVSIEDTRELNLPRENWLPSVARSAIGNNSIGEVDLFKLLKNSFRQNPDYVIVGEVRGQEAFVLFQGMASGHSSISTFHADSVDTVIKRLETPPIELSPTLINTLDAIVVMNHVIVKKEHTRRLTSIVEIINVDQEGVAVTNTPFIWNPSEDKFYFKKESKVFEKIKKRYGLTEEQIQREFIVRTKLLYEMFKRKIFDFYEIQKVISEYYKQPENVLRRFGIYE